MVAYADLILRTRHILNGGTAFSLLDRPISDAESTADAIRQPVLEPEHNVRAFQDVLLDLGSRLGLSGMIDEHGNAKFPGGYKEYMVHHERTPGIGSLAGWRGPNGDQSARGAPNEDQLNRYIANGCFWREELAPISNITGTAIALTSTLPLKKGSSPATSRSS